VHKFVVLHAIFPVQLLLIYRKCSKCVVRFSRPTSYISSYFCFAYLLTYLSIPVVTLKKSSSHVLECHAYE